MTTLAICWVGQRPGRGPDGRKESGLIMGNKHKDKGRIEGQFVAYERRS